MAVFPQQGYAGSRSQLANGRNRKSEDGADVQGELVQLQAAQGDEAGIMWARADFTEDHAIRSAPSRPAKPRTAPTPKMPNPPRLVTIVLA